MSPANLCRVSVYAGNPYSKCTVNNLFPLKMQQGTIHQYGMSRISLPLPNPITLHCKIHNSVLRSADLRTPEINNAAKLRFMASVQRRWAVWLDSHRWVWVWPPAHKLHLLFVYFRERYVRQSAETELLCRACGTEFRVSAASGSKMSRGVGLLRDELLNCLRYLIRLD